MNLYEYETRIRKAIRHNEVDSFAELSLADNYPILLTSKLTEIEKSFRKNRYFEFVRSEEGFYRFNYKPGTVFADLSDWKVWDDDFIGEEHDELVGEPLITRIQMHDNYSTRIMLHTEQGEGPKNMPELFNPGKRMAAPEEVAIGLSLIRIIEMVQHEKIRTCFPRNFYKYPRMASHSQVIFYNPHEVKK